MYRPRLLDNLDVSSIFATLLLAGLGIFFIASATLGQPGLDGLWRVQFLWLVLATVGAMIIVAVDYRVWGEAAFILHGIVIVLLVLVLFFGREVGGNRSWLVFGPVRLQPSELAKWTTCLVLAVYLAKRVRDSMGLRQLIEMSLLGGAPVALIGMQPDMGTVLVFLPIFLVALLIGCGVATISRVNRELLRRCSDALSLVRIFRAGTEQGWRVSAGHLRYC